MTNITDNCLNGRREQEDYRDETEDRLMTNITDNCLNGRIGGQEDYMDGTGDRLMTNITDNCLNGRGDRKITGMEQGTG